jgi:hypothetical protein
MMAVVISSQMMWQIEFVSHLMMQAVHDCHSKAIHIALQ